MWCEVRWFRQLARNRRKSSRRRFLQTSVSGIECFEPRTLLSAGDLDPRFGDHGLVTADFGGKDSAYSIALQSDGKIVAVGGTERNGDFAIARFQKDGKPDLSFGNSSRVTTAFGGYEVATAVRVTSNGKIFVAGASQSFLFIARYIADGSLDRTFGTNGRVTASLGDFFSAGGSNNPYALPILAWQNNDNILVAGNLHYGEELTVFRFHQDGILDSTFGNHGTSIIPDGGLNGTATLVNQMVVQKDGRIVFVYPVYQSPNGSRREIRVVRLNADGSLDNHFGNGGIVTPSVQNHWSAHLALQNDGRIVLAAEPAPGPLSGESSFELLRLNSDGSLDSMFGNGGRVSDPSNNDLSINSLVIANDGRIVLNGDRYRSEIGEIILLRYDSTGNRDMSFGVSARLTTTFGGIDEHLYAMLLQPDGNIVAAGTALEDFALARFLADDLPPRPARVGDLKLSVETTAIVPADATDLHLKHFFGGERINLPIQLQNVSGAAINGSYTITVSLASRSTVTSNMRASVDLASKTQTLNLKPNANQSLNLEVLIPRNSSRLLKGQSYVFLVQIIGTNGRTTTTVDTATSDSPLEYVGTPKYLGQQIPVSQYFDLIRSTLSDDTATLRAYDPSANASDLTSFVRTFEGDRRDAYLDNATPPNPTIGIGLNLNTLSSSLKAALIAAVRRYYASHYPTEALSNNDKIVLGLLKTQARQHAGKIVISETDDLALFNAAIESYRKTARNQFGTTSFDGLSQRQQIALVDLFFNSGTSFVSSLKTPIRDHDFVLAGFELFDALRTTQGGNLATRTKAEYQNLLSGHQAEL